MCWMTITCGKCGGSADIEKWTTRPVSGDLPRNVFQCPKCNWAFERKHGKATVYPNGFILPGPVSLNTVEARL